MRGYDNNDFKVKSCTYDKILDKDKINETENEIPQFLVCCRLFAVKPAQGSHSQADSTLCQELFLQQSLLFTELPCDQK